MWPFSASNSGPSTADKSYAAELHPSPDVWVFPAHFTGCHFFCFLTPTAIIILEDMAMSSPFACAWCLPTTLAMKGFAYMMAELHWTDCGVGHYAAHSQNSPYLAYIKPSYNCLFKGRNIPSRWKSPLPLRQALFPTLVTRVSTSLVWSHNWKLFSCFK